MAAPSTPGTYEFRYFLAGTRVLVKTSNPFTVTAAGGGFANGGGNGADLGGAEGGESGSGEGFSLTANPPAIAPGGVITGKWSVPAGRLWNDWVGLFKVGDPNSAALWWNYTGGATSGSFSIPGPAEAGSYELRYLDSGNTQLALSNRVTVGTGSWSTVYTPGVSQRENGVDSFFHPDWLDSTRYLTDGSGNTAVSSFRFDAFGGKMAGSGPDSTAFKFAGGWGYQSDAPGGLQLLGARYYDPEVGRFISPDPIGLAGGLNLYAYCDNDPAAAVDPDGLDFYVVRWDVMANQGSGQHSAIGVDVPGRKDIVVYDFNPIGSGETLDYKEGILYKQSLNLNDWSSFLRPFNPAWGTPTIVRVPLDRKHTAALGRWLEHRRGLNHTGKLQFHPILHNCSTFATEAIEQGAGIQVRSVSDTVASLLIGPAGLLHSYQSPNRILDWARSRPGATTLTPRGVPPSYRHNLRPVRSRSGRNGISMPPGPFTGPPP